jgi:hypothetical protein
MLCATIATTSHTVSASFLETALYVEAMYNTPVKSNAEKTRLADVGLSRRDVVPKMQGYSRVKSTDDERNSPQVISSHS